MDETQVKAPGDRGENTPATSDEIEIKEAETTKACQSSEHSIKKAHAKRDKKLKSKKSKEKTKLAESDSESSSSSDDSDSEKDDDSDSSSSSSSSDSDIETDKQKKKRKLKAKKKAKQKAKDKKEKKEKKEKKKAKLKRKAKDETTDSGSDSDSDSGASDTDGTVEDADADKVSQMQQLQELLKLQQLRDAQTAAAAAGGTGLGLRAQQLQAAQLKQLQDQLGSKKGKNDKKSKKRASKLDFKRVDQLWDSTIHNYKLTDTKEDEDAAVYDQYIFNVRRRFDWEGKYRSTVVDIKSKLLREALNSVMDGVKGISLVEETPAVDPNLLFLYLEDLRKSLKQLKKRKNKDGKKYKKKELKKNKEKVKHVKILLKYLDKDYAETKKTLYPMLESGLITFDLLWALYKPNTLAYTTTYGTVDEPRAFKIDYANKETHFMKGEWYSIEGRYLEYDGKTWGMGTMEVEVPSFKGARKITSLACYPLKYNAEEDKICKQLIERGKKFVSLQGVHYKHHEGLAYTKKKRQIIKVNVNGRVMIDPAIHRRMLPNYQISTVKPKDPNNYDSPSDDDDESEEECGCGSDSENDGRTRGVDDDVPKTVWKFVKDDKDKIHYVEVPVDDDGNAVIPEKLTPVESKGKEAEDAKKEARDDKKKTSIPIFSDEEYLIASPVVLGFAFGEKLWLEFTVSGIREITWNEGAYESLVLENNTKDIVKALVESHKYKAAESIDDVIQGKGKGLVAVLHGPPGTGKTLTAEGIAELLKCPLYMVTAGELGTDPRILEAELEKVLSLAHSWGAVLLLDEADVFLEKRTIHDIHRNALVSIFLRLLEYFQGILFLTTNRVETFDEAFQSRIHIALRYGELTPKAKKAVFKLFIERVRLLEGIDTMPFTEEDFTNLAKHTLNGRQIKNTVRTAQALAVNKGEPLSMVHLKRVLDVALAFDRDLKGGTGYEDAMRNYY